jgi:dethiobiotin synthetase
LKQVLDHIRTVSTRLPSPDFKVQGSSGSSLLLIEGAGGLVSPLGEPSFKVRSPRPYMALDLITALSAAGVSEHATRNTQHAIRNTPHSSPVAFHVLVVAPNRLGTINHTLLTLDKLRDAGISKPVLVLNDLLSERDAGLDRRYNGALLSEIVNRLQVVRLPYLGKCSTARDIRSRAKKVRNSLRKIYTLACL